MTDDKISEGNPLLDGEGCLQLFCEDLIEKHDDPFYSYMRFFIAEFLAGNIVNCRPTMERHINNVTGRYREKVA